MLEQKSFFFIINNSVRGEHETDITKFKDKDKDFWLVNVRADWWTSDLAQSWRPKTAQSLSSCNGLAIQYLRAKYLRKEKMEVSSKSKTKAKLLTEIALQNRIESILS